MKTITVRISEDLEKAYSLYKKKQAIKTDNQLCNHIFTLFFREKGILPPIDPYNESFEKVEVSS